MSWTTFQLKIVTPLFSGDDSASVRADSLIRVPSIRGALRFWLRTVAAGQGVTDLNQLAKAETAVFGDTTSPSPIQLRTRTISGTVTTPRAPAPQWCNDCTDDEFYGARYLLGQGLWNHHARTLTRACLDPGSTFELQVRGTGTAYRHFLLALWAWLAYGGLGARVHRGFGRLSCLAVNGPLPEGWTAADFTTRWTIEQWRQRGEQPLPSRIADIARHAFEPAVTTERTDRPLPEIPALNQTHWAGSVLFGDLGSLGKTLHLAGTEWRAFRAVIDRDTKDPMSTASPEWTTAILGPGHEYPISALGLPVGYFRPAGNGRTAMSATVDLYQNDQKTRRASPVWLLPYQYDDNRWGCFTCVFYSRLAPTGSRLVLNSPSRRGHGLDLPGDQVLNDALDNWVYGEPRIDRDHHGRRS